MKGLIRLFPVAAYAAIFGLLCYPQRAWCQADNGWILVVVETDPFKLKELKKVRLPYGTELTVVLLEELGTQRNMVGDQVVFALKDDLIVDGMLFVARSTPVLCEVTYASPAKGYGADGFICVGDPSLWLPYGKKVKLASKSGFSMQLRLLTDSSEHGFEVGLMHNNEPDKTERDKAEEMLADAAIQALFGGGNKGLSVTIPAGAETVLRTAEDSEILSFPEEVLREQAAQCMRGKVIDNFLNFSWEQKVTVGRAFRDSGYEIDPAGIEISGMGSPEVRLTVWLAGADSAVFRFRPFEDVGLVGYKFKPIFAENEAAKRILNLVR